MSILDFFEEISSVPRCSGNREKFIEYFKVKAYEYGYSFSVDSVGNILCKKGIPKICLQAHYDMVCIGDSVDTNIEIYEEKGYLKAKNSTLGADNGIAIAYILKLMESGYEIEILLTSDEEIGLIGAFGLEHNIQANKILNLDTEEEGEVYIGCAGGVDLIATKEFEKLNKDSADISYRLKVFDLAGGHSGVDINKDIPNAIKVMLKEITNIEDIKIISINGGERSNSIPKSVEVDFYTNKKLEEYTHTNSSLSRVDISKNYIDSSIVEVLNSTKSGVLEDNIDLNCVHSSQNLAIIEQIDNKVSIVVSQRSMNNNDLNSIEKSQRDVFESFGFSVESKERYGAWEPKVTPFVEFVKSEYSKFFKDVNLKSIHAGLECSVLIEKFPDKEIVSIGPNIYYPHSIHEMAEIKSISHVFEVLKSIINNLE
jgi:dipeptidase D